MVADTTDTDDPMDFLFAHKLPFIKEIIRVHGVPVSGSKPELREKLSREIGRGSLGKAAILSYLDQIEGWGNQHVFLYKSSSQQQHLQIFLPDNVGNCHNIQTLFEQQGCGLVVQIVKP